MVVATTGTSTRPYIYGHGVQRELNKVAPVTLVSPDSGRGNFLTNILVGYSTMVSSRALVWKQNLKWKTFHFKCLYITIAAIFERKRAACTKDSCMKRWCLWRASTDLLDKASHLTAFCAWDSSPHLPVTPSQLMRPGIGWLERVLCSGWLNLHNTYIAVKTKLLF